MSHAEIIAALSHAQPQFAFIAGLLALAPLISKAVGAITGGRAKARVQEAGLNADQDKLAIDRSQIERDARLTEQANARRGALLEGVQDASFARPEGAPGRKMTGGLRPSAIAGGSALGKQFKEDSLARLLAGTTPGLTPAPKANGFDKFLNIVGGLTGAAGLAGQARNMLRPSTPIPDVNVRVNSDPSAIMSGGGVGVPLDGGIDPSLLPPKPFYRPKFTSRF